MLRAKIQKVIAENPDPKAAAIQVCLLLEGLLDLEGNGWFDGDEELEALLAGDEDEDEYGDDD
jgi:hypothetical protein